MSQFLQFLLAHCVVFVLLLSFVVSPVSPTISEEQQEVHQPRWKVGRDFYLVPEVLGLIRGIDEKTGSPETNVEKQNTINDIRIFMMMRRYRKGAVFGLLENKLLNTELMERLNIPTAGILYGAFARKAMGNWQKYDRQHFLEEMSRIKEVSVDHHFVMKPLTDGGGYGILAMTDKKWRVGNWTLERVADFAEDVLQRNFSRYGQEVEHIGVMVQRNIRDRSDEGKETGFGKLLADSLEDPITIELKMHVAFGEVGEARIHPVPWSPDDLRLDTSFCEGSTTEEDFPFFYGKFSSTSDDERIEALYRDRIRPLIQQHEGYLRKITKTIADTYVADWVRVDVFLTSHVTASEEAVIVNEVTYPSHNMFNLDSCTVPKFLTPYRYRQIDVVESKDSVGPLLEQLDVTWDEFLSESDYHWLWRALDFDYDVRRWGIQDRKDENIKVWIPPMRKVQLQQQDVRTATATAHSSRRLLEIEDEL